MDIEQVRQLVELMKEHELTELLVRDGEKRIVLRRGGAGQVIMGPTTSMPGVAQIHAMPAPAAPAGGTAPGAAAPATAPLEDAGLVPIRSPMVGTFYSAPDPDSKPYAGPGTEIGPETVICVIEAMKVFNEIKPDAGIKGQIKKILVSEGQAVEYGTVLFLVG